MKKIIFCLVGCMFIFPSLSLALEESREPLKAAFIKDDNLWIKIGENEKKITNGDGVSFPKWSFDGNWLAYLKGDKRAEFPLYKGELWFYNIKLDKHFKVHSNIKWNFQWAPDKNMIGFQTASDKSNSGFQSEDKLYMTDVRSLKTNHHISSGISNFSWLPDGEGFISSEKAGEHIDSDIVLSKISLKQSNNEFTTNHLYTIPVEKNEYFTTTSTFKWSHDHQWIAFLLNPTASL